MLSALFALSAVAALHAGGVALDFLCAQLDAANLAGDSFGQVVGKLNPAHVQVAREPLARENEDFLGNFLAGVYAGCQRDVGGR